MGRRGLGIEKRGPMNPTLLQSCPYAGESYSFYGYDCFLVYGAIIRIARVTDWFFDT